MKPTPLSCRALFTAGILANFLAAFPPSASAQDIGLVAVVKGMSYFQENADVVRLDGGEDFFDPFYFEVFVAVTPAGAGTTAAVTPPGRSALPLMSDDGELFLEDDYETQVELDADFPNGTCQVAVDRPNDGPVTFNIAMSPEAYPNPPRVSNYGALQGIGDVSTTVIVQFDAFAGGGVNDRIFVEVCEINPFGGGGDCIYENNPLAPGAPDGTATQIGIPPNVLEAGKRYELGIGFAKVVSLDTTTAPGVTAIGVFEKFTCCPIRTAGDDGQPPEFRTVQPGFGRQDVNRAAVAAFGFSEALDTSVGQTIGQSISWTGLGASAVTYEFSPDDRTVFAVFSPDLPAGTQISWTLNPAGAPNLIRDVFGNPYTDQMSGDFTTGSATTATDLDYFELAKGGICLQADNSGGVDSGLRFFYMEADLTAPNSVLSGSITASNGNVVSLAATFDGTYFDYEAEYPSVGELDQFFPNSGANYQVTFDRVREGPVTFPVLLPAADDYPAFPTPQPGVLNFDAAQEIDASQPFTLQISDFTNGGADDPVFIEIDNDLGKFVLESPDPGEAGALNGTSGDGTMIEYVIPADTLFPGRTYEVEVIYAKVQSFEDSGGVERSFSFVKVLEVEIRAQGPIVGPVARVLPPDDGFFAFEYTGEPCRNYAIDASEDAVSWHSVNEFPSPLDPSGVRTWVDWDSQLFGTRFYRVREFPFENGVLVQGRVESSLDGQGIPGATVSLSIEPDLTAGSDSFGNFTLPAIVNGDFGEVDYTITVEAPGYQPFMQTMNWGNFPPYQNFVLTPE